MSAVEAQFTAPEPGPIDIVIFASGPGRVIEAARMRVTADRTTRPARHAD